jgi:hypothetical protein
MIACTVSLSCPALCERKLTFGATTITVSLCIFLSVCMIVCTASL